MKPTPEILDTEPVFLSAEDRNRMSRLYEEVRIRLEEMAMITLRTLSLTVGGESEVRFCPLAQERKLEFETVELVRTSGTCGCYDYRKGLCFATEGADSEDCPSTMERS